MVLDVDERCLAQVGVVHLTLDRDRVRQDRLQSGLLVEPFQSCWEQTGRRRERKPVSEIELSI